MRNELHLIRGAGEPEKKFHEKPNIHHQFRRVPRITNIPKVRCCTRHLCGRVHGTTTVDDQVDENEEGRQPAEQRGHPRSGFRVFESVPDTPTTPE